MTTITEQHLNVNREVQTLTLRTIGLPQPIMVFLETGRLRLFFEEDDSAEEQPRKFQILRTGSELPPDCVHVGSCVGHIGDCGPEVFHVYELL